jgi:hypothetical protein
MKKRERNEIDRRVITGKRRGTNKDRLWKRNKSWIFNKG